MPSKKTRSIQENFWAGDFGNRYITRNQDKKLLAANLSLFTTIINYTNNVESVIEFGANIGLNLLALKTLLPHIKLSAVEINEQACRYLKKINEVKIYPQSIFDFKTDYQRDFVLSKGFLIHINPKMLPLAYQIIYNTSCRYICLVEYFNPRPVKVVYRGFKNQLFKRDFCQEMLEHYKDLKLVNYGFSYHRDNNFLFGDANWFLLEKCH